MNADQLSVMQERQTVPGSRHCALINYLLDFVSKIFLV